jgi:SAM-dependent methyltransferase
MEHQPMTQETAPLPSTVGAEQKVIAELIEISRDLRRTSAQPRIEDIQRGIARCHETLGEFISTWDATIARMGQLRIALINFQAEVRTLIHTPAALSDLQFRTLALYYVFEGIPSQLTAAIEERQRSSGESPTRYELLNAIIAERGAKSYLEIGCCADDCFNHIQCSQRVGVDPSSGGTLRMKSDEFFAVNVQKFDLIFIDGLHEAWQVDRDITNALASLRPNGIIVMHDCNPLFDIRTLVPRASETWNGDVWKSFVRARSRADLDCAVGRFDHGCGVIVPRPNSSPLAPVPEEALVWDNLCNHRTEWLRPMELPELMAWIRSPLSRG